MYIQKLKKIAILRYCIKNVILKFSIINIITCLKIKIKIYLKQHHMIRYISILL